MSRYARQTILPEIGATGQARLGDAHVLVIGAGGLAATALPLLAGAGVGEITVVDGDRVALSNLHRQHLFAETDCGAFKAEIAAQRCHALNQHVTINAHTKNLTPDNVEALLDRVDMVLDCADSFAASYILSDACLPRKTPLISASALGFGGYVGGFCGAAPSLRAVFPDAPDTTATCETAGVMGPVVSMIGAMQAQMALAHLIGLSPSPLGQMIQVDARTYRNAAFRFDAAPEPERSFSFVAPNALKAKDTIIELRPETEAATPAHPDALRLDPATLPDALPRKTGRLALCCATGLRAWRTADRIQSKWPGEIVLVAASAS